MSTWCRISLATCKIASKLQRCFGNTASAQISCTSQGCRMQNRKITWTRVSAKGSCEFLSPTLGSIDHSCLILRFTVYPRHRTARRDQPAFKVKSVLKGSEYEGEMTSLLPPCLSTHRDLASQYLGRSSLGGFNTKLRNRNGPTPLCLESRTLSKPTPTAFLRRNYLPTPTYNSSCRVTPRSSESIRSSCSSIEVRASSPLSSYLKR